MKIVCLSTGKPGDGQRIASTSAHKGDCCVAAGLLCSFGSAPAHRRPHRLCAPLVIARRARGGSQHLLLDQRHVHCAGIHGAALADRLPRGGAEPRCPWSPPQLLPVGAFRVAVAGTST